MLLTMLLIGLSTLMFKVQPVGGSETIYIMPDGSVYPSTAPIVNVENVTYTFTGNIYGFIVVERDNIVVDGAGYMLQGAGNGTGMDLSGRSNITIMDMEIKAFEHGIWLNYSSSNTISGNNITANDYGVVLDSSSNNTLRGNSIDNNKYNFGVWGLNLSDFINDVDASNTVNGKPIYYWISKRDIAISADAGYVALVNCTRITVQNLSLTNNWESALLAYTTNSTIIKNNITNNYAGIVLHGSSNNSISANHITNHITNNPWGIVLEYSFSNRISGNYITNNSGGIWLGWSFDNSVSGNNITNNHSGIMLSPSSSNNSVSANHITNNNYGIWLAFSSNNSVSGNNITNNEHGIALHSSFSYLSASNNNIYGNNITANKEYGIKLDVCSNNSVSGNNITNNHSGIVLEYSSNNSVSGNNIAKNSQGIMLHYSSNNTIYHNSFVNNKNQVYDLLGHHSPVPPPPPPSLNVWDDGVEGNYWSNYTGVDSNHDGIGDSPHVIYANTQDNYPLMGMFHSFNTSLGKHVNVISNSTIEDFEYLESNSTIKMYVSGEGLGFCRVNIPHLLMNVSSISVIIDDRLNPVLYPNYTLYDNGTHRWIYFAYEHSTHKIDIVPEFPSFLILPLFMIATLLAAIVYKKRAKPDRFYKR